MKKTLKKGSLCFEFNEKTIFCFNYHCLKVNSTH